MIRNETSPWFHMECELKIGEISLSNDVAKHMYVKRIKNGDIIFLFNKQRQLGRALITGKDKAIIETVETIAETKQMIQIAIPYSEPKLISKCIIKATELGCANIDIIHTQYSMSNGFHKKINNKHLEKWRSQIIQACQQSENIFIPNITIDIKLADHIEKSKDSNIIVMGFTKDEIQLNKAKTTLYVGPEGGFSQEEVKLFNNYQAQCLHVNNNVLRVETALCSGLGILHNLL